MVISLPGLQVLKVFGISFSPPSDSFSPTPWVFFCNRDNHRPSHSSTGLRRLLLFRVPKLSLCVSNSPSSWLLFEKHSLVTSAGLFGFSFARFAFVFRPLVAARSICAVAPLVPWPAATAFSHLVVAIQ